MNRMEFFDYKKSIEEIIEMQEKLTQGLETMVKVTDDYSNQTKREIVFKEDKLRLFHYSQLSDKKSKVPTLIIYALVNTPAMMDIQQDKSFIKSLLEDGEDIYLIEWGFPTPEDRYITLDDYIKEYINDCVDYIRQTHNIEKINLLGVCQGGTFSVIYSALYPKKIKNLITLVTPVDFSTNDGLLFKWGKYLNPDRMVEAFGVIPGDFMNTGFLTLKPLTLMVNKYLDLIDDLDNPNSLSNFMSMEKWIFNSPGQAGEAFRKFINDLYHDNKLIKGELEIGDEIVNMKKITMPILNIYALRDNQVPNAASIPLEKYVGSKDVTTKGYPTGHIGLFVSGCSQREVVPMISMWLKNHSK